MKKINEGILMGVLFLFFAVVTYKTFAEDNLEEKESKKELIYSVVRLSSTSYENKIVYFIKDNGYATIKQLDSIREKSDADVKHELLKILNNE